VCLGSATAVGGALAQSYGSDLLPLRLLFAHMPAASFVTPPTFRKVFTGFAMARCPPRNERSLCPAFRRLSLGRTPRRSRQSYRPVLIHSSNQSTLWVTAIRPGGSIDGLPLWHLLRVSLERLFRLPPLSSLAVVHADTKKSFSSWPFPHSF
jgi:hypothetical protein